MKLTGKILTAMAFAMLLIIASAAAIAIEGVRRLRHG